MGINSNQFNTTIRNCKIFNFTFAIYLGNANNGTITNVNTSNTTCALYYTGQSKNNHLSNFKATIDSPEIALYLSTDSSNNTLSNFTITATNERALFVASNYNDFSNFTITSNTNYALYNDGQYNNFSNFIATSDTKEAIFVSSSRSKYSNFIATSNTDDTIYINGQMNVFSNFTATSTSGYALYLHTGSNNNQLTNFNATSISGHALHIKGTSNTISRGKLVSGNGQGNLLSISGNNNLIYWNNFTSTNGLYVDDLNGFNKYNTTISGQPEGNIWPNVMDGSVAINGSTLSLYGNSLVVGSGGAGYPYDSTTSQGKVSSGVVDYAPLISGCANHPPDAPLPPAITPAPNASQNEILSCSLNCPPSPLPVDPDNPLTAICGTPVNTVEMQYLWNRTRGGMSYATAWAVGSPQYNCASQQCQPGDTIRLYSRACDQFGACSAPVPSSIITITVPAASPPPPLYDGMYAWTALSIGISFLLIALLYMAGKFLEIPILDAWAKTEVQEIAASAVIAVLCISLIATTNSAAQFLSGESGATDVISAAKDFLETKLYADGRTLYVNLARAYFNIARVVSYTFSISVSNLPFLPLTLSYSQSPGAGLSPLLGQVSQGMDTVANFMTLAAAQFAVLTFFGTAAAIMLPIGIFLRSFSFTRRIGGTLLAAAIAAAVIYPSSVLLSKAIYETYRADLTTTIGEVKVRAPPEPPLSDIICSPAMTVFLMSPIPFIGGETGWFTTFCIALGWIPGLQFFCSPAFESIIKVVFILVNFFFSVIMMPILLIQSLLVSNWSTVNSTYYAPMSTFALQAVVKYSVLSLVSFIIPVMVTVTLIKGLASYFGGEQQLYGLSKLI